MSRLNKILFGFWILSLAALVFVVVAFGIDPIEMERKDVKNTVAIIETHENFVSESPKVEEPVVKKMVEPEPDPVIVKDSIRFAMLGDVLLHLRLAQYKDFSSSFATVTPLMQSYDYLLANQESPPVGNKYALSGYPKFSSPPHIIRDLQNAGVDMVNLANNHTVDKGEGGIRTIFENLAKYNMPYAGAYKSKEDASAQRILEFGSIKIGVLGYTYGTNGLYLPKGSPFIVNYIQEEKMTADIKALRGLVDVVVVSMHWGPEYTVSESDYQRHHAKVLNKAGADIIFGSHPHVLQPYKKIKNDAGHETHVFYSLGNYFSTILTVPNTMVGGIGSFEITKEGETVTIGKPQFDATATLLDKDGVYRVYPLADVEARAVQNLGWVKKVLGEGVTVH
ncbi:poly-gamma-glutamate biosynthesis protein [Solibacillus sp. R5-41]|uniref:CapA family protein n=1 Tax=Solibacillus sp. R5-41 TaxID=2048654 RepID=UPI000C126F63|nr:CapA family protein [Solibacillus sp. R5-41]ATP39473.1 poly-gamma-glutamate biosynthesis protein [Solibacillus sp. R5-41]